MKKEGWVAPSLGYEKSENVRRLACRFAFPGSARLISPFLPNTIIITSTV